MKEPIFKGKEQSLSLLGKDFIETEDRELKGREVNLKERYKSYFLNQLFYLQMIWISLKKKK